ncbi:MAG: site-2 protease family protein [Candidatus Nomurabacteria bacterium]|jgi:regulator of sigma E protease|nr:site-2 protease family protein [Candidatus Nomurabacteria bacterium]
MEWWQLVVGIVVGLLLLMIIVTIHELGHALMARRNKVVVEEFGLGFPPRARVLGKYKGTLVTLNWLPIGGFCKLKDEFDSADSKGSYGSAGFWAKTQILLAGVTANALLAVVIFTILALFGMPKMVENQFTMPSDTAIIKSPVRIANMPDPDSPAGKVGLQQGDEITAIDGQIIDDSTLLPKITEQKKGEVVNIEYRRGGQVVSQDVELRDGSNGGYLGVSVGQSETFRATWSAPIVGVVNTGQFMWWTLQSLGNLAVNFVGGLAGTLSFDSATRENAQASLSKAGDSVSGPVGILGVIFPNAMMSGLTQLMFISGIISLTLAIMNLLPIPGLDGGRWLLTAIFRLIKKPLTEDLEAKINGFGMLFLYALILLITVVDVAKLW